MLCSIAGVTLAEHAEGRFGAGFLFKMLADFCGHECADDGRQRVGAGLANAADAAEMFQQALAGAWAHAGYGVEFRGAIANLAPLAMVADGEAMALVTNHL